MDLSFQPLFLPCEMLGCQTFEHPCRSKRERERERKRNYQKWWQGRPVFSKARSPNPRAASLPERGTFKHVQFKFNHNSACHALSNSSLYFCLARCLDVKHSSTLVDWKERERERKRERKRNYQKWWQGRPVFSKARSAQPEGSKPARKGHF